MLLFARPRELAGTGVIEIELGPSATASLAFDTVAARVPGLASMRGSLRCAVDGDYVSWETALSDGAEVALIPPTAGG